MQSGYADSTQSKEGPDRHLRHARPESPLKPLAITGTRWYVALAFVGTWISKTSPNKNATGEETKER